jgi:hypothetical protein
MSATVDPGVEIPADLLERGLQLSSAAKVKFANLLLDAVEGPPDDPEVARKEVKELIADRIEGYLSGRYKAVDAEEQLAEVEKWYKEKYPQ